MKLPEILPPADLLDRVDGVKRGLRQRRRLGRLGWAGFLAASTLQVVVLAVNSPFGQAVQQLQWATLLSFVAAWWPYLLPGLTLVLFLVIASWSRFWLQESKAPFRYTCSVAEFRRVAGAGGAAEDAESSWAWLSHDLAERLNQRVGRLRFVDPALAGSAGGAGVESHVHLSGSYGIRKDRQGRWVVEVTPRVRIGPSGSPETLAHAVVFPLAAPGDGPPPALAALPASTYDRILERVYFSVASELYKQIQRDVGERIELLPTDYFRAVALFHEAEDYARSNTLDAYEEARQLYWRAAVLLDPALAPLPAFRARRAARRTLYVGARGGRALRCGIACAWPRLGNVEVMCARAEIGYATMILYRRDLAGQSGQLLNSVYEARPVAARALARLTRLPRDVPGRHATMFDAHVVLALASSYVGASRAGERHLAEACRLDPNRTLDNARYLYATGLAENSPTSKIQVFRRVVELAPRFESAQFMLAGSTEKLWRTRPVLERNVAEIVFAEYDEVSKLNPGNIGAWANRGYMSWLLGEERDLERAREAFESGREYKAIKRVTFVAELDYGLARIAAEQGNFRAAFEHYLGAVPAILALGHASGTFEDYYFEHIGEPMFQRFTRYRRRVEAHWSRWEPLADPVRSFHEWLDVAGADGDGAARVEAATQLTALLTIVDGLLTNIERAAIEQVIARHAGAPAASAPLARGLPGLARLLAPADGPAHAAAALAALRDPEVTRVVDRINDAAGTSRVRNIVLAFVLNDYGQACYRRFQATGDEQSRVDARAAYGRCIEELNPDYVMPHYNLHVIATHEQDRDEARQCLDRVIQLAPDWPEGRLAYARLNATLAGEHAGRARALRAEAGQKESEARKASHRLDVARRVESRQDGDTDAGLFADEAGRVADGPARLLAEAQALAGKAADEERRAARLADAAIERVAGLVPHVWLWRPRGDGRARFRWDVLDDRDLARELVWERECSELHARALHTLTTLPDVGGENGEAWRLLQHLRRRFWPDDFSTHQQLRDLLLGEVRGLVAGVAYTEVFTDATHRALLRDGVARGLLRRRAWLRLVWTRPASVSLLVRRRVRGVLRSRLYRALIDLPEVHALPDTETEARSELERVTMDNVVGLLRGPSYAELLGQPAYLALASRPELAGLLAGRRWSARMARDPDYRALRRQRISRGILDSDELRRLVHYADFDRTIRWQVERWLEDRQYPFWALTWVSDRSFASDEDPLLGPSDQRARGRRAILERASQLEGRVPAFYFRVGEQLRAVREGADAAIKAYVKAMQTDDVAMLHDVGRRLKELGRLDESLEAFRRALHRDPKYVTRFEAQHRGAIAAVLWALGRVDEAIDELQRLTERRDYAWRTHVVRTVAPLLRSGHEVDRLRGWLESVRPDVPQPGSVSDAERDALADLHEAVLELARVRDERLPSGPARSPSGEPSPRLWPVVTPVALEVHAALLPTGDGWEREHPLFKRYAPDMRARIEREMGVRVPGLRVRSGDGALASDAYTILLDEVPEVTNTVVAGAWFCSASAVSVRASKGKPPIRTAYDPGTGRIDGVWVAASDVKRTRHADAGPCDHFEYMIRHVEALLRQRLGAFVGVQELENMLEAWQDADEGSPPSRRALVARAVPDTAARLQLLDVLRRLLREHVPVRDLGIILDIFGTQPTGQVTDARLIAIVDAIRMRVREWLPGNHAGSRLFFVAPAFEADVEAALRDSDGRRYVALPQEQTTAFLRSLRQTIAALPPAADVIVVRRDGVRTYVHRVVELEFPRVPVLSFRELLPRLRRTVSATVDYPPSATGA